MHEEIMGRLRQLREELHVLYTDVEKSEKKIERIAREIHEITEEISNAKSN